MTKIKNTKKGMAKKTLSISLAVAMLATSNVPVWAAEFTDGTDAAFTSEVEAPVEVVDEAPVVEEEAVPMSSVVTDGDIKAELTVSASSLVWGTQATVDGTILNGSSKLNKWNFAWKDADGIAVSHNENVNTVASMNLTTNKDMAGKTLSLWIYRDDAEAKFNINTGITVTVEKKSIGSATTTTRFTYNGFAQDLTGASFSVKDVDGVSLNATEYTVKSSTSATNAGDKVVATITATEDSAYIGTKNVEVTIGQKAFQSGDIVVSVADDLEYQYTGEEITIPADKVTLKESQSEDNGVDGKLNGADLSGAITEIKTTNSNATDSTVTVTVDTTKLKNFKNPTSSFITKEKVAIAKRDLANNCTITAKGNIPRGTAVKAVELHEYLKFMDGDNELKIQNNDYTVSAKNENGTTVTTLNESGDYTLTINGNNKNTKNSQTISVHVADSVITKVTGTKFNNYEKDYTGATIEPGKDEIGSLTITYVDTDKNTKTKTVQSSEWEITGYTNNTEASLYSGTVSNTNIKKSASVEIQFVDGIFVGQKCSLPFEILPLTVTENDITVPKTVTYNEKLTEAKEYALPVGVVAKSKDGKTVKTLSAEDFTVEYKYEDGNDVENNNTGKNELHDVIRASVKITNTNYIMGTRDGKTFTQKAAKATEITAKSLTDAMITVNPKSYVYTGGTIKPEFSVMDGFYVLYEGDDYKVKGLTEAVNVGTGKITIEGINDSYSGTASATFEITPADTKSVKVEIEDQQYTGKRLYPQYNSKNFKVTLNGNDVSNQFEVTGYGENIAVGKGTVKLSPVAGNKNFTGNDIVAEFNIVSEKVEGKLHVYDENGIEFTPSADNAFTFDGTAKTFEKVLLKDLKKTDKSETKATADDFEIKYVDNVAGQYDAREQKNFGYVYAVAKEGTGFAGEDKIVTSDGTVIKGVVAKVKFYIDAVEFVKQNVTVKNGTYAGGLPVKPEILIQIGGHTLVEGTDYTVKFNGNTTGNNFTEVTNSKPFGIEITGKGGYSTSKIGFNDNLKWGIDKKDLKDCDITVEDGVVSVKNGAIPVANTEFNSKNNGDGTYTITADKNSKNYTGSKTVDATGKAEGEKPDAPVIEKVNVVGNKATVVLSGESEGAIGYDYVISTDKNCITSKNYNAVNKNKLTTTTDFTYVEQDVYYAYCHSWKRGENGEKIFSDWSNPYPFVITAMTPSQPKITSVKVKGSTVTVTYTKTSDTDGYDVVLGKKMATVAGEKRPVEYDKLVKKNQKSTTVTFKNVPDGTYYVGLHSYNRRTDDGKKVFSPWSQAKKITVR